MNNLIVKENGSGKRITYELLMEKQKKKNRFVAEESDQ